MGPDHRRSAGSPHPYSALPGPCEDACQDAWQGVGLGRQLVTALADLARGRGVRTVTATVQADNDRMVWLIRRLFPGSTMTVDSAVYEIRSPLTAPSTGTPAPPASAGATALLTREA